VENGDISDSELAELRKLVRDHGKTKPTTKP
jgi:hypothetical protein